jgi:hypothetical protein
VDALPQLLSLGFHDGGEMGKQLLSRDPKGLIDAQILQQCLRKGEKQGGDLLGLQSEQGFSVFVEQAPTPVFPALRHYGDSQGAKVVQVPQNGPAGHLQLFRQFLGSHLSPLLEKEQQGEQPVGTHASLPFFFK